MFVPIDGQRILTTIEEKSNMCVRRTKPQIERTKSFKKIRFCLCFICNYTLMQAEKKNCIFLLLNMFCFVQSMHVDTFLLVFVTLYMRKYMFYFLYMRKYVCFFSFSWNFGFERSTFLMNGTHMNEKCSHSFCTWEVN